MTFIEALQVLQTLSVIAAIVVAVSTLKRRGDDKTVALTEMRVDIKYIKEKVNGYDSIKTELAKTTASAASAHKRLDEHLKYEHRKDIPMRDQ